MHTIEHVVFGSVTVPGIDIDIATCAKCVKVASTAFGYMGIDKLVAAMAAPADRSEGDDGEAKREDMLCKFTEASEVCEGTQDPTWGTEDASKERWFFNDEFVDFQGFEKAQFVAVYGADPATLGLPAMQRRHPVTGATVEVFYAPKPGPLFTMRVATRDIAAWRAQLMPQQLYQDQGLDTISHIAQNFEPQQNFKDVLLSLSEFQRLLHRVSPQGKGNIGKGVVRPPASSGNVWNAGLRSAPSRPLTMPTISGKSESSASGSAMQQVKIEPGVVTPQKTIPRTTWPSPPAKAPRLHSPAPSASFGGRGFSPRSPSIATGLGTASRSSHLTLPGIGGGRGGTPLSVPGIMPDSGAASDTASVRSGSTPLDPELQIDPKTLSACQFQRAIQKCPTIAALKGCNMASVLQNLKKMATIAQRGGHYDLEVECTSHAAKVTLCVAVTWPAMATTPLSLVRKNIDIIVNTVEGQRQLNAENYMWYAGKFALDILKGRPLNAHVERVIEDEWWKIMDVKHREVPKFDYNLDQPSFWMKEVTSVHLEFTGTKILTTIVIEGLYMALVQKGPGFKDKLMEMVHMIYRKLNTYNDDMQKKWTKLMTYSKGIAMLFGGLPFECDSNITNVEAMLAEKKCIFVRQLRLADSWTKPVIDGMWSTNAAEMSSFKLFSATLAKLSDAKHNPDSTIEAEPVIQTVLQTYPAWKCAMRPSAISILNQISTALLLHKMDSADFSKTDNEEVNTKNKALLDSARRALTLWPSMDLEAALRKCAEFAANVASLDMRTNLVSSAILLKTSLADSDKDNDEALQGFSKTLPEEGVVLVFIALAEATAIVNALDAVVTVAFDMFPQVNLSITVAAAIVSKVNNLADDGEGETQLGLGEELLAKWATCVEETSVLKMLRRMQKQSELYFALGGTVQERVTKDENLATIKGLIRSKMTLNLPLPEEFVSKFKAKIIVAGFVKSMCEVITSHGALFLAKHLPSLQDHFKKLQPMAQGSADNKSWKDNLADDATKAELLVTAKSTIMRITPQNFIVLIKNLHQAPYEYL